jgi:Chaperone of endosialidase
MDKGSEAIFSLQPVSFRYKNDPELVPQFGLVAEEVAKVNPALVVTDVKGKPFTVRYDEINAMLLNEFLKEHCKVEQQQSKIEQQGATIAQQQKQIDALTAGLQKVSAQLELSKAAPRTVQNSQ